MSVSGVIDAAVKAMNWENTCIAFQMKLTDNASGLSNTKTEYWPQILVGSSEGRFERNGSRALKGKKLERRLSTDIFSATECLSTKYHKLNLDHFADEYTNVTNYFEFYFALPFLYRKLCF